MSHYAAKKKTFFEKAFCQILLKNSNFLSFCHLVILINLVIRFKSNRKLYFCEAYFSFFIAEFIFGLHLCKNLISHCSKFARISVNFAKKKIYYKSLFHRLFVKQFVEEFQSEFCCLELRKVKVKSTVD